MHVTKEAKRIHYVVFILISIFLGLASRNFNTIPHFIREHAGDTLWAIMVYFLFRLLSVHKSPHKALFLSLVFCFFVEFSQLYQANWINTFRSTLFGGLILGKGFLPVDLVRYSIGIVLAYMVDNWIYPKDIS